MESQPNKAKRKKPLGAAISWSDTDLDALARVSETDLKAASALWKNEAPVKLKNLLDAKVEDSGGNA